MRVPILLSYRGRLFIYEFIPNFERSERLPMSNIIQIASCASVMFKLGAFT